MVLGDDDLLFRFSLILEIFTIVMNGESSGSGTIKHCRQVPSLNCQLLQLAGYILSKFCRNQNWNKSDSKTVEF